MDRAQNGPIHERDRFAALAFAWADVLLELDPARRVVFAAGATRAVLNRAPESLIGFGLLDLICDQDRPVMRDLLRRGLDSDRFDEVSIRLKGESGPTRPMALAGYRLAQMDGHYFIAFRLRPNRPRATLPGPAHREDEATPVIRRRDLAELSGIKAIPAPGSDASDETRMTLIALENLAALRTDSDDGAERELLHAVATALKASGADKTLLPAPATVAAPEPARLPDSLGDDPDVAELEQRIVDYAKRLGTERPDLERAMTPQSEHDDISGEPDMAKALMYALTRLCERQGTKLSVSHLSSSLSQLIDETVRSVDAFRAIVKRGAFHAALQPIVHLNSGKVHHFEALARFSHDQVEIEPHRLIHFAEGTGLICSFDLAMARKVIDIVTKRRRVGDLRPIAVNISGFSLGVEAFVSELLELLAGHPALRGQLMFEVTETAKVDDLVSANNVIQSLRTAGHHVCLDDFGAGAANFEYLNLLHVDVIKIDGRAMQSARNGPKGRAFLRATASLCQDLGIATIAEMVDDEPSLEFVRQIGIDYGQGFLLGRPEIVDNP